MLDVIAAFMSGAMVDGFAAAVETRDQVHADVLIGHALLKEEFGEISLEEGLRRLRDQPGHRLRHLVGWFDAPRLVQMTDANEYREASVALNRAALKAQGEPTVDHIAAWLFAHARFQRAQAKFPLSKPAEPVKRSPRVKAAVALTAGDFSAEAQAAIVALAGGNERAGRREIAALIARGADPKGHLAAILCKLDDGHRQHVDELAATIARQTGAPRQRVATIVQAGSSGGDAAVTVESAAAGPAAQPVPDDTAEIDEAAAAVALETLRGWVERSWQYTGSGFIREAGLWVFPDTIRNPMAAAAYPIAGRSAAFQAILRERLEAAE